MILVDRLARATVSNGVLRIDCVSVGPDGAERPSGEILIPVARIGAVLGDLDTAMKRLRAEAEARLAARAARPAEGAAPAGGGTLLN